MFNRLFNNNATTNNGTENKEGMNMFKNFVNDFKAAYEAERLNGKCLEEQARIRGEEVGAKLVKCVYHPSFAVGYTVEGVKDVASKVACTKAGVAVSNAIADVKFSAKEGYENGSFYYLDKQFKKMEKEYEDRQLEMMSGGPVDEEIF